MARTRQDNTKLRKLQILEAAIALSLKIGYKSITRDAVAKEVGVSGALVAHYFTMCKLKRDVLKTAIEKNINVIVAQGICLDDPLTRKLTGDVKRKILQSIGA